VLELVLEFEFGSVDVVATAFFVQLTPHSTNNSTRIMQMAFFIFPLFPPVFLLYSWRSRQNSSIFLYTELFAIIGYIALNVRNLLIYLKDFIVPDGVFFVFINDTYGLVYLEQRGVVFP
jgi:hypothetical protein